MVEFRRNNRSKQDRFNRGNSRPNRNNDRRDSSREPRGECLTLRIEKMVQGGEGMARLEDGRVCFVAGALPGELCKVRLTFQKKDFTKGRIVEVLEASPDRVKPLCPLYGKCGGCSLQHLASEKQAEYLEKVERENLNVKILSASLMRNCPKILSFTQGMPGVTGIVPESCSAAIPVMVLQNERPLVSVVKKAITSSRLKNAPCSRTA